MLVNWNTNVYTQERSILTLTGLATNGHYIVISTVNPTGYSARYVEPNDVLMRVDMSDLVRLTPTGEFRIDEYDAAMSRVSFVTNLQWEQKGLIQPTSVIVPKCALNGVVGMDLLIMPPPLMLAPLNDNCTIKYELFGNDGYYWSTGKVIYLPDEQTISFAREMAVPSGAVALEFWHIIGSTTDRKYYTLLLKELDCERRYAMVEWVSYTGVVRRHTFEVVKITTETTDNISLLEIDNQYNTHKNRVDSLTLRLEGLDIYGLWYYSDMITSNMVKITIDGVNWYQSEVKTKKQTLPETDAGKLNVLEITVNYRRYDTI